MLGPAQVRDERPHIIYFQSQGDIPSYIYAERFLEDHREGPRLILGDINLSLGLFTRIL